MPVYSRAGLPRTVAPVVALSLTAASTGAAAREFRVRGIRSEDCPTVQALPTVDALRDTGRMIAENSGGRHQSQTGTGAIDLDRSNVATIGHEIPGGFASNGSVGPGFWDSGARSIYNSVRFEAAMPGIDAKAPRDAAAARLIERIRKME